MHRMQSGGWPYPYMVGTNILQTSSKHHSLVPRLSPHGYKKPLGWKASEKENWAGPGKATSIKCLFMV